MEIELDKILNKLFDYFNVATITELANVLGVSKSVISNWKKRNSISPIKIICRRLGIYEDIFGNMVTQAGGNVSGNNNDIIQNTNNSQIKKINEDLLSPTERFILEQYSKAESVGEGNEFIKYMLNYKGNN